MRRFLLLVLVVLLALGTASASALTDDDLNALARYYGEDALIFGSVRIDDAFIDELDALLNRVMQFLPEDQRQSFSLATFLRLGTTSAGLGSFEEDIRPWLGDTLSIGLVINETTLMASDAPILAAATADGEAALEYFTPLLSAQVQNGSVTLSEANGFTIYSSETDNTVVAFTDDAMFITTDVELLPKEGTATLADSERFQSTIRTLPAEQYNLVLYVDTPGLNDLIASQLEATGGMDGSLGMTESLALLNSLGGALGIGATIFDGSSLTLDIVQSTNLEAARELGLEAYIPRPVDLGFANRIPADAPLVIHGSEFGPTMQANLDSLRGLGDYLQASGGLSALVDPQGTMLDEDEALLLDALDPALLVGLVNTTFAGFTGLSLERDVLPVLDGDAALYLRLLTVDDFFIPVIPDAGLLFQSSSSADALVDAIVNASAEYGTDFPTEDYGTGTAMVIPAMETLGFDYAPLDLLIGSSDGLFMLGTRGAAQAALNTEGGLADDAAFLAASNYFLEDSQQVWYVNSEPLFAVVDTVLQEVGTMGADEAEVYALLSIIHSASISAVTNEEGESVARLVLTLAEEPRPLPVEVESFDLEPLPTATPGQ